MTVNPIQFGDVPVPEGHTRLYRGDWAPGNDPGHLQDMAMGHEERLEEIKKRTVRHNRFLKLSKEYAARSAIEGRWVTPDPKLAQSYPVEKDSEPHLATVVNFVDVPNHVWEQIQGLKDQPDEVKYFSKMKEHEAVIPEEYLPRMTLSRQFSTQEGLDVVDNQNTYL